MQTAGDWLRVGDVRIRVAREVTQSRFGLSSRELEVLGHTAIGRNVNEIAEEMGVSPNTVNTFKARLFRKLNVTSSVEVAIIAAAVLCGGEVESARSGAHYDTPRLQYG